ncbi:MAG: hypothetical protein K6G30_08125 [Acetatifactor sp.]|nr:hypothetical protein [Acetatifactor sp.]
MSKVNLEEFAGGALQEKFDDAMEKVLTNLMDPNTPWKNKRKISIEVTFEQTEDRNDTAVNVSVVAKLAPVKPIATRMAIGKDLKSGKVFAEEYGSQIKGQMTLDDYGKQQTVIGEDVVDTETGEVVDNVVDLRAKQA